MYMTVQGRRHIDHGEPLSLRLRLIPGSEARLVRLGEGFPNSP